MFNHFTLRSGDLNLEEILAGYHTLFADERMELARLLSPSFPCTVPSAPFLTTQPACFPVLTSRSLDRSPQREADR